MRLHRKKIAEINGLMESLYVAGITGVFRHAYSFIERGGQWTFLFIPFVELVKLFLYWSRTQEESFTDSPLKTGANLVYKSFKFVAAVLAVGLALAGTMTLGFGIMIASGYLSVLRNLGKALRSAWEGDAKKVASNLTKAIVGGLISVGFTLMTFFPPLAWAGALMVFIGTGYAILTLGPSMVAEMIVPPKQVLVKPESPAGAQGSISSSSAVGQPLILSTTSSSPSSDTKQQGIGSQSPKRPI